MGLEPVPKLHNGVKVALRLLRSGGTGASVQAKPAALCLALLLSTPLSFFPLTFLETGRRKFSLGRQRR